MRSAGGCCRRAARLPARQTTPQDYLQAVSSHACYFCYQNCHRGVAIAYALHAGRLLVAVAGDQLQQADRSRALLVEKAQADGRPVLILGEQKTVLLGCSKSSSSVKDPPAGKQALGSNSTCRSITIAIESAALQVQLTTTLRTQTLQCRQQC